MVKEPVIEFKDIKEAYKYLKEWQERLFLQDWIIKLDLVKNLINKEGDLLLGSNNVQQVNKDCLISLAIRSENIDDGVAKFCHEHTLIHELLHCKYISFCSGNTTIENTHYMTSEHALLEQMSKSLLMAKYNLKYDWFKNFKESK